MSQHLLIIEDDTRLATMVAQYLEQSGYTVTHAGDGAGGLAHISQATAGHAPDLVILDLMLPDMDGLDVCRRLRGGASAGADTPVLMLTARGDAIDRIVGLEIGADDYLPKPFEPRELLARLRAILRRRVDGDRGQNNGRSHSDHTLRFGRLEIDTHAHLARCNGVACELTAYQYQLLLALAQHAGRVLSREQLMELVKGEQIEAFDRSIDVHMSRIRAAVEDDPRKPRRIITVRGAGYLFAKAQD
ncbi:MAG: response regulator transcription factor [Sphingomonadaceae bacterium]